MASTGELSAEQQDKYGRLTVPSFSIEWAVALCTCNFMVPGLGTLMAGLTICLPCSNKRGFDCGDTCCSACIQLGIALMQLLLTPFCLVGWIWSCVWGFAFIGQSAHDHSQDQSGNGSNNEGGPGVVVVAAAAVTEQPSSSSGYLNYAFHFKAPVAVHPYGPPPAYTAELPAPPSYEEAAEISAASSASASSASASASSASGSATTEAQVIQQQPQSSVYL